MIPTLALIAAAGLTDEACYGGGAVANGANSGAGGNGAAGIVVVITYF